MENAEPLLKNIFGHTMPGPAAHTQKDARPKKTQKNRRKAEDRQSDKETCLSGTESYLSKAGALVSSLLFSLTQGSV